MENDGVSEANCLTVFGGWMIGSFGSFSSSMAKRPVVVMNDDDQTMTVSSGVPDLSFTNWKRYVNTENPFHDIEWRLFAPRDIRSPILPIREIQNKETKQTRGTRRVTALQGIGPDGRVGAGHSGMIHDHDDQALVVVTTKATS